MIVEAVGIETGDLVILLTMVGNDFTAGGLERRERGGPSTNVGRVEGFGDGGIMDCKG